MKKTRNKIDLEHTRIISLRLTNYELDFLDSNAEKMHYTRSEYLRELILNRPIEYKYEIVADINELKILTTEFGRIGNNLNQIAKYFNTGGNRSLAMEDEIHECIHQLFILRKQVLRMAGDFNETRCKRR
ncbi:MAG: plasmid mobilization relaxosome protein MobC [Clostridia bacterium]|nr:plasmid mobilization relaxosome protein MobC [Clostridia bacterium]